MTKQIDITGYSSITILIEVAPIWLSNVITSGTVHGKMLAVPFKTIGITKQKASTESNKTFGLICWPYLHPELYLYCTDSACQLLILIARLVQSWHHHGKCYISANPINQSLSSTVKLSHHHLPPPHPPYHTYKYPSSNNPFEHSWETLGTVQSSLYLS